MSKPFNLTGGARIGSANATYPFADLHVDENILKINASLVGNLVFQPQDIISIEPYNFIPLLGQGIKINHRVANYEQKVIFWTLKNPDSVLHEIKNTGFMDQINSTITDKDSHILEQQKQGGFPLKPAVGIFVIIAWNVLIISDFVPIFHKKSSELFFGPGICTALGLLFTASLLSLISGDFRKVILKEGRGLEDIKKIAYFLLFLSGFMFSVFLAITLS